MTRALKVFGGNLGKSRVIAACSSVAAFCKLSGVSRGFASETGSAEEISVASSKPGVPFYRSDSAKEWTAKRSKLSRDLDTLLGMEVAP